MIDIGRGVQLVTRPEWQARAPLSVTKLTPSYGTTTHWEGPKMGSFPHSECAGKVREIQRYHMETKGWVDIAYTGLTCPHGYAYEGRWIGVRTAANGTNDGNNRAYAVCYLGGQGDPFTPAAQTAQRAVLDFLDVHGGAGPGRNCHRDWKSTECPGDEICSWVRDGQPAAGSPTTGGLFVSLTPEQEREIYDHIVGDGRLAGIFRETAADDDGRLREVTLATRQLLADRRPAGYFAKSAESERQGVVYWVTADHAGAVAMPIGGALHEHLKVLTAAAGYETRAEVLEDEVLAEISRP